MSASRTLTRTLRVLRDEGLPGAAERAANRPGGRRLRRWSRLSKRDLLRRRQCLRVGGYLLEVPPNLMWAFPDGSYYERNVDYWFRRGLAEHPWAVVFDVGANCGYYTLVAAGRARKVYAFEPASPTRRLLNRTVSRNNLSDVEVLPYALGQSAIQSEITLYDSSGNNSVVKRDPESVKHLSIIGREQVSVLALDDLLTHGRLLAPDLVKLDIEGSELSALRGARETLRTHRPMLIIEHDEEIARDAGYSLADLREELETLGYRVRALRQDPYEVHEPDLALYELAELAPGELGTLVAVAHR